MLRTSCTTSSPDAGGGWFALTTNADPDKQSLGDLVPAVQTALIGLLDDADELEGAFQEALLQSPVPDEERQAILNAHDAVKLTRDAIARIDAALDAALKKFPTTGIQ